MKKTLSFKDQIDLIETGEAYAEASGIFGLDTIEEESSLVIIPVPWDATASYKTGTASAPEKILEASKQIDHYDMAFDKPYAKGIHLLEISQEIKNLNDKAHALKKEINDDKMRAASLNPLSFRVNKIVEEESDKFLKQGKTVAVLGGEHSAPYGLIKALSKIHKEFGILHVDAHFDLRAAYEGYAHSHASIMHNVLSDFKEVSKIVSLGIRDFCSAEFQFSKKQEEKGRSLVFFDRDIYREKLKTGGFSDLVKKVIQFLPEKVYISFDIDGLETQFCPSTGTPVPGGIHYNEACYLLEELAFAGKTIIGFDLCEVAPDKTGAEWDENVGMRILYKLCGAALHKK
jgi:agmatinase